MRERQRTTEELGHDYEECHGLNPLAYVVSQVGANSGYPLASADTKIRISFMTFQSS
jgi:hypothetical protein